MALSGVRNSWLMLARKAGFRRVGLLGPEALGFGLAQRLLRFLAFADVPQNHGVEFLPVGIRLRHGCLEGKQLTIGPLPDKLL